MLHCVPSCENTLQCPWIRLNTLIKRESKTTCSNALAPYSLQCISTTKHQWIFQMAYKMYNAGVTIYRDVQLGRIFSRVVFVSHQKLSCLTYKYIWYISHLILLDLINKRLFFLSNNSIKFSSNIIYGLTTLWIVNAYVIPEKIPPWSMYDVEQLMHRSERSKEVTRHTGLWIQCKCSYNKLFRQYVYNMVLVCDLYFGYRKAAKMNNVLVK